MPRWMRWIERLSTPAFAGGVIAAIGGPLAATAVATGPADAILVGTAIAAAAGAGWAARHRARIGSLPLEFAPLALRGRVDGYPVYRFRIRLGAGRAMFRPRAEVTFVPDGGAPIRLAPVLDRAPVLVGPWTVAVVDERGACDGPGAFTVRVIAEERGRVWALEQRWPKEALRDGRFGGLSAPGGRLRLDPEGFAEVVAER